jgi:hypothetical protein
MKKIWLLSVMLVVAVGMAQAESIRVVILDFEDESGMTSDKQLGGTIDTKALAEKGALLMTSQMLGNADFVLVDRRDFMSQLSKLRLDDEGKPTSLKPSYLDAARALNADVLLKGSMMSFSTGKQKNDQGGYKATMARVSMSVAIQAQNVVDGGVIAMSIGNSSKSFRQTAAMQTELSEDDILEIMGEALTKAIPKVTQSVNAKMTELSSRPRVKLNLTTTEDPAMLEIDGVLVGSTPFDGLEIYKGEHLLHVSRPGYESITKRMNLSQDTTIQVPMLRTDLTADEKTEILKSADLKAYLMDGRPDMIIQTLD